MSDQVEFFLRVFLGRIAWCCVRILFMYIRCSYVNTYPYMYQELVFIMLNLTSIRLSL